VSDETVLVILMLSATLMVRAA